MKPRTPAGNVMLECEYLDLIDDLRWCLRRLDPTLRGLSYPDVVRLALKRLAESMPLELAKQAHQILDAKNEGRKAGRKQSQPVNTPAPPAQ